MALKGTSAAVTSLLGGRDVAAADEGDYYVAVTPTPGTGIISGASVQAFTETTPYFTLYNSSTSKNIYPMFLKTHLTVVGATASVAENWTFTIDTGNRYTSTGTALVAANTNMTSPKTTAALTYVGAIVATAATGQRRITAHVQAKHTVIEVVHDTICFNWGGPNAVSASSTVANSTTPTYAAFNLAPVVIGPGQSLVIVRWAAAQTTGSTNEFEFAYVER